MKKITIAIDGFSSCGKSTMAKSLAKSLGYIYIDSGAMYRAVSLFCLQKGLISQGKVDENKLETLIQNMEIEFKKGTDGNPRTFLNGTDVEKEIRGLEVSGVVSMVSAIPFVREAMVRIQQSFGKKGGIVMDGRDIGTVVFPDAELKIFVTADACVRARRRYDELVEKGQPEDFERILKNIENRDYLDQTREISPLKKADDAIVLDNSHMTLDEQDKWLIDKAENIICR